MKLICLSFKKKKAIKNVITLLSIKDLEKIFKERSV